MGADAESSCTESRTDSWSPDGERNPWSAPTTELWAPTPREVAPLRHPIPQPVEVVHLVGREIVDAHSVHAGAALFARTFSHASKTRRFRISNDFNFFCFGRSVGSSPEGVGLQTTVNYPAPSLGPHYRALTATTSRSAPVPRIGTLALAVSAACGSPPRSQKPQPSLSGRQVLLFHASACDELTPPIHPGTTGATYRKLPD